MEKILKVTEIVRIFEVHIENYNEVIKAKIVKVLDHDTKYLYEGTISHFCKKKDEMEPYKKGLFLGENLELCSAGVLNYLERFNDAESIVANNDYK
ncbi:hypothetical protein [Myroides odoratus]|uniref:Uncharacterized protein n=1 Tax=Myroides odoratus TaxID=256 RepID=A0A9Q6Z9E3_MYROD|nr:hypothetical protein [Myroides odoratus]EHQ41787.1 hypothetical protein Myrod_0952 [Myroides odoratus DSM 2801]EKB08984.1 hypothetical protein HMPREF9716_00491 [Myroides odoratus CIP 103059]QQT99189.1 hypothetical protein I6I88_13340 [Myroides odoratus]WQD58613.1 hypothetical protein U0010_05620 [Myroides odoratus]STZ29048.1 Uncharacterised protein [Myroides odoratus]